MSVILLFLYCLFFDGTSVQAVADDAVHCILFSYNRPMQLYALLESMERHIVGHYSISIVYKVDSERMNDAYCLVFEDFPKANVYRQNIADAADFKKITDSLICQTVAPYLCFFVDDIIVTDDIDFHDCCTAIRQYDAYGFYLRLGLNVDYCYTTQHKQRLTSYDLLNDRYICWGFSHKPYDWGYPHTLDGTIYPVHYVQNIVPFLEYHSPNTLEGRWHGRNPLKPKGIAYRVSMLINVPCNRVQHDFNNICNMKYATNVDPETLCQLFIAGYKINTALFDHLQCNAPHAEVPFEFIKCPKE